MAAPYKTRSLLCALALSPLLAFGQTTGEVKLVPKPLAELTQATPLDPLGEKALAINPDRWIHAETPHFVLHYRRLTEAQKVAREVEFTINFVAKSLGATPDRYARKSHVYIFEDEAEWREFIPQAGVPEWSASFALGDALYLNVRRSQATNRFASDILAHETTHAVVTRLYPGKRWPLWLNEGFAEYMGGAGVAARKNQSVKRHQNELAMAEMPVPVLVGLTEYPQSQQMLQQLYQTSEKVVRFLMNELPKDRFPRFVDAILAGAPFETALMDIYRDKLKDMEGFNRRYERFSK